MSYANLALELRKLGSPIASNDMIVAATALHFGHDVLVGRSDEAHFRVVPRLAVVVLGR